MSQCRLPGHDHLWRDCPNNRNSKNFCGADARSLGLTPLPAVAAASEVSVAAAATASTAKYALLKRMRAREEGDGPAPPPAPTAAAGPSTCRKRLVGGVRSPPLSSVAAAKTTKAIAACGDPAAAHRIPRKSSPKEVGAAAPSRSLGVATSSSYSMFNTTDVARHIPRRKPPKNLTDSNETANVTKKRDGEGSSLKKSECGVSKKRKRQPLLQSQQQPTAPYRHELHPEVRQRQAPVNVGGLVNISGRWKHRQRAPSGANAVLLQKHTRTRLLGKSKSPFAAPPQGGGGAGEDGPVARHDGGSESTSRHRDPGSHGADEGNAERPVEVADSLAHACKQSRDASASEIEAKADGSEPRRSRCLSRARQSSPAPRPTCLIWHDANKGEKNEIGETSVTKYNRSSDGNDWCNDISIINTTSSTSSSNCSNVEVEVASSQSKKVARKQRVDKGQVGQDQERAEKHEKREKSLPFKKRKRMSHAEFSTGGLFHKELEKKDGNYDSANRKNLQGRQQQHQQSSVSRDRRHKQDATAKIKNLQANANRTSNRKENPFKIVGANTQPRMRTVMRSVKTGDNARAGRCFTAGDDVWVRIGKTTHPAVVVTVQHDGDVPRKAEVRWTTSNTMGSVNINQLLPMHEGSTGDSAPSGHSRRARTQTRRYAPPEQSYAADKKNAKGKRSGREKHPPPPSRDKGKETRPKTPFDDIEEYRRQDEGERKMNDSIILDVDQVDHEYMAVELEADLFDLVDRTIQVSDQWNKRMSSWKFLDREEDADNSKGINHEANVALRSGDDDSNKAYDNPDADGGFNENMDLGVQSEKRVGLTSHLPGQLLCDVC